MLGKLKVIRMYFVHAHTHLSSDRTSLSKDLSEKEAKDTYRWSQTPVTHILERVLQIDNCFACYIDEKTEMDK